MIVGGLSDGVWRVLFFDKDYSLCENVLRVNGEGRFCLDFIVYLPQSAEAVISDLYYGKHK